MTYEDEEAARVEMLARAESLLRQHGFKVQIGGCGCCGSPWVRISYNGEPVLHEPGRPDRVADGVELNMFAPTEPHI